MIVFRFGIGNILALIISLKAGNDVLWVIAHCIFGWFYVIYAAILYSWGIL